MSRLDSMGFLLLVSPFRRYAKCPSPQCLLNCPLTGNLSHTAILSLPKILCIIQEPGRGDYKSVAEGAAGDWAPEGRHRLQDPGRSTSKRKHKYRNPLDCWSGSSRAFGLKCRDSEVSCAESFTYFVKPYEKDHSCGSAVVVISHHLMKVVALCSMAHCVDGGRGARKDLLCT